MIKFFLDQSKKDLEKYLIFHQNYKMFITEGVLSEDTQDKRVSFNNVQTMGNSLLQWKVQ